MIRRFTRFRARVPGPWLAAALVCVAVLPSAACSGGDDAAPFAEPAVTLSRTRVPIGGPIDVTYRFTVLPDAEPLARDYRVLSHFVDSEGELMWTDDHDPPTPSSTWQPGQTIEYTRTVFVPIYPYIGEAAIYTGLYSPDEPVRVPLRGDDDGLRAYRVATVELAPQSENIFLIFKDGWHQPESAADNPMVEWQWTAGEATLSFRNPRQGVVLYLHFDSRPDLLEAPQQVTLRRGDQIVETFSVDSTKEQIRRIPITAGELGADELVELRLEVDRSFVPAEIPAANNQDARELGIRVFHAFVEPAPGANAGA